MSINTEELYKHFLNYFKLFSKVAPKNMVDYVGGEAGMPNAMASSFESCIEFSKIIDNPNAKILSSGAGVSSWMIRKLFKNVYDTDPDLEYLKVVKNICEIGGLSGDNFIEIPKGDLPLNDKYDYCYYDYGNIERMPYLKKHIEATKIALYIDDTDTRKDCSEYRNYVYKNFSNHKLIDCVEATDVYGRWGIILIK